MLLKCLFVCCIVLEFIFVPLYLKAIVPVNCHKSLIYKMICSSCFVAVGVLSALISGNNSHYAVTMLIGLTLGLIGDYFLHAKPTNAYFVTGFLSFLFGHIAYIIAFVKAIPVIAPEYQSPSTAEISFMAAVLAAAFFLMKMLKIKFGPVVMKVGAVIYSFIIVFMFVKASALGFCAFANNQQYGIIPFLVLSAGSFLFVVSDATLAIIRFGGKKKNQPLKAFNIITYFAGQIMLASSVLFINA